IQDASVSHVCQVNESVPDNDSQLSEVVFPPSGVVSTSLKSPIPSDTLDILDSEADFKNKNPSGFGDLSPSVFLNQLLPVDTCGASSSLKSDTSFKSIIDTSVQSPIADVVVNSTIADNS